MSASAAKKLIDRSALAASLGVSARTIFKYEQDGMPVARRGRRGVASEYDEDAVRSWLTARGTGPGGEVETSLQAERARKEHALALLAEQRFAERAGLLLEAEDVARTWGAHVAAVRAKLLAWEATLTDRFHRAALLGLGHLELEIGAAVRDVLAELAVGDDTEQPEKPKRPKKKVAKKKAAKKASRKRR